MGGMGNKHIYLFKHPTHPQGSGMGGTVNIFFFLFRMGGMGKGQNDQKLGMCGMGGGKQCPTQP